MVVLCKTAQNKGRDWPDSHKETIQDVADSWEHPNWPSILSNLLYVRFLRDHPEGHGPWDKHFRPSRLQQVAWQSQSKAVLELIKGIAGLRRHLLEGFTRSEAGVHSSSIIIKLTELFYRQPGPADPPNRL